MGSKQIVAFYWILKHFTTSGEAYYRICHQVDAGTAWAIGYFYATKSSEQKIIGIRTHFRWAGESRGAVVNAMIKGACDWIVRSTNGLLATVSHLL